MTDRRGLLMIHTGDGKGKTTAALGLALRAWGAGLRVSILQFVKQRETGEHRAVARIASPDLEIGRLGTGFTRKGPPSAETVAAARRAMVTAKDRLTGGRVDLVILDEIFAALAAGLVTEAEIAALAALRPAAVHLLLTGRGAPAALVERADLVTEMRNVKHPFERGLAAQAGIEF
jgi:cob(I)alamin adenosyltransferase